MRDTSGILVLDANIFLVGIDFTLMDGLIYTTPKIIEEIKVKRYEEKNRNILNKIEAAINSKKLILATPSEQYVYEVEKRSKSTGDFKFLSGVDKELIALTLDLIKNSGKKVRIYSNDYSVENVCLEMGITFSTIHKKGIESKIVWQIYCQNCKIVYNPAELKEVCENCGSKLKRRPKRKKSF
ncbi:hypothetical protein LCGC14_0416380 [marine sediment metagenome]|uniref:Ribonuclease PIN domain-containing protein n=1 Tax=marine sediment metagenome TaxID=412755 RepID=A0A0F9SY94_9ZZZZ|nr:MAG: Endoribonuclease Nob1 [Candidatus Lokiarchaeum sp. GC14_75]